MTNQEAKEYIMTTYFDEERMAMKQAVEALENVSKYGWHIVKDCLEDLPRARGYKNEVVALLKDKRKYIGYFCFDNNIGDIVFVADKLRERAKNVRAWLYIEPFEEEE